MATNWNDKEAGCPYFLGTDGKKRITCQGVDGYSDMEWKFRSGEHRELQFREFCCKKYEYCEVYRMLDEMEAEK